MLRSASDMSGYAAAPFGDELNGVERRRQQEPDFREALALLRLRKWSIAVITLLVGGLALGISLLQTPIYESEAQVLVRPVDLTPSDSAPPTSPNMATEEELAGSVSVAGLVVDELGLEQSAKSVLSGMSVSSPPDTEILVFGYSHSDPETAQRFVQAFADAYLEYRKETAIDSLTTTSDSIQSQIDVLTDRLRGIERDIERALAQDDATRAAVLSSEASRVKSQILQRRLGLLSLEQVATVGNVVVPADIPLAPVSPVHPINMAFGLLAGLALGVGLAFLRDRLSGSVRGGDRVEGHLGAPILALIPRVTSWKSRKTAYLVSRVDAHAPASEAYRLLRTNLLSAASSEGVRTLLVTSGRNGEGKSTTTANLGMVLAQAGRKVVLLSADFRQPRLHEFFRLDNKVGLSDILMGKVNPDGALVRLHPAATAGGELLRVITSGSATDHPAELLSSDGLGRLIQQLSEEVDFVLIDGPPLTRVTDAVAVSRVVDGVLFVVGPHGATEGNITMSRQQLDIVGARVIGGVLNNFGASMTRTYVPL